MFKAQLTFTIITRSLDTISRPDLQCTFSTDKGAFSAEMPIMALQANTFLAYLSHPTGSPFMHLTLVESSNVNKLLAEGQKCQAIWGSNPSSQHESQVNTPVFHSTSNIPRHTCSRFMKYLDASAVYSRSYN